MIGQTLPDVTFKTRVRDESVGGLHPYRGKIGPRPIGFGGAVLDQGVF